MLGTTRDFRATGVKGHHLHQPRDNLLLGGLQEKDQQRIFPQLELVPLATGQILHESGREAEYAYFPIDSVVSLIAAMDNETSMELSLVGREGLVGASIFLGNREPTGREMVVSAGHAFRLKGGALRHEFRSSSSLQQLLLRYTQALFTQIAQTAVCCRHHSVEQQLCRRLLLSIDRMNSTSLTMTHKLISELLGVRRAGITEAAGNLQASGLISYKRGRIIVLNLRSLEERCCECYRVVKSEFDRLLPDVSIMAAGVTTQSRDQHIAV